MVIDEEEIKQHEFTKQLDELEAFPERGSTYIDLKETASKNVKKLYDEWEKIAKGFKNKILPLSRKVGVKTDSGNQQAVVLGRPKQN